MRILQIVTLISGVGAFGGPTRVAVNQCEALRARGHETLLLGGAHELPLSTATVGSAPVRLFPTRQLSASKPMAYLWSPPMLSWLHQHVRDFDVVHVHLGRDGITLPAAALAHRRGRPYVAQTHGMIRPRPSVQHRALDWLATRRVLRNAHAVFALSPLEATNLNAVLESERQIDVLPNGIPAQDIPVRPGNRAGTHQGTPEFLFLARLHPRKRALNFVAAATALLSEGASASFTVVGPDGGDGPAVTAAIQSFGSQGDRPAESLRRLGPLPPDHVSSRLSEAYVYVLPSVNEPFPMSLIEAMAVGRPVVITESNGLAEVVKEYECGIVIPDDSVEALKNAMKRLLAEPDTVARMGRQAEMAVRDRLSIDTVVDTLEKTYQSCCNTMSTSRPRSPEGRHETQLGGSYG